jgi:hypothetical protein
VKIKNLLLTIVFTVAFTACTSQPTSAQTQLSTRTPRAYNIGDTGPAGGLIFYDKGDNSDGWRYLEAAPAEAEFRTFWSAHRTRVGNTQETIGSGKQNTQLIVEVFRQTMGEWDTAAQYADDLVFNRFDDWFLPSREELNQMYGRLKRRNLGDFQDDWYWSSSQNNNAGWNDQTYAQHFVSGVTDNSYPNKTSIFYVRPIRQVPGLD